MKSIILAVMLSFVTTVFAAEVSTKPEVKKTEQNCVTKDKKGNCPAVPKSPKPTPKKKTEAK